MKLSIVIPVLNSHEIVRRQMEHFIHTEVVDLVYEGLVEVIIVDDGSDPPLWELEYRYPWFELLSTNDKTPWTQPKARNIGGNVALLDFFKPCVHLADVAILAQNKNLCLLPIASD